MVPTTLWWGSWLTLNEIEMSEQPQHISEENKYRPRDVGVLQWFLLYLRTTQCWRKEKTGLFHRWVSLACWYKWKIDCCWSPTYCMTQTLLSCQGLEQPPEVTSKVPACWWHPMRLKCCLQDVTHLVPMVTVFLCLQQVEYVNKGAKGCN